MINRETIDKIFTTARVEEIISEFVHLKRAGSNLKGLSPFADEKSPSFMVSPSKQIWKDFSSGKGGNVVGFLMEHEHFSYVEALRYLAKKYNIEIVEDGEMTPEEVLHQKEKESLYVISEFANKFFQETLLGTEEGKSVGLAYFKSRDFTEETIKKFQLGYSPDYKSAFYEYAIKKGYKQEVITKSGLCYLDNKTNHGIDRFRSRVIFPIFSISGRVLGFGGRTLSSSKKVAKYLNSPESDIYHKSDILYGMYQSKTAIIKNDSCFLVEGYTDVISLHQNGIENVVASSGTALTENQIRLIKRFTENITILFDGDSAGIKASFRSIDLLLEKGMNVKVLLFPDGDDPDGFARKHKTEEIKAFIEENSTDFIRFKTQLLLEDVKDDPIKKAGLIREIVSSIALIDNLIKKELYIQECSKLLDISENVLQNELATIERTLQKKQAKQNNVEEESKPFSVEVNQPKPTVDLTLIHEEEIIQTLFRYGDYIIEVKYNTSEETYNTTVIEEIIHQLKGDSVQLKSEFYQNIIDDIASGLEKGELRSGYFYTTFQDQEVVNKASDSLFEKYKLSENWEEKGIYIKPKEHHLSSHVMQIILRYKEVSVTNLIKSLTEEIAEIQDEERETHFRKIIQLTELKNQINQNLNRVV
ncbi:MAG: DNA primase [Flavobacteriales bacterium]|nr:DNA primase [Flavobacteriales bacterium]